MAATGECQSELIGAGGWAAYCGNTLCGVALLYLFAWYCCECCARSVKVQRDPMKGFLAGKKTHRSLGRQRVRSLKPRAISRSNNCSSSSLVFSDLSQEIHNILALPMLMLAACIRCLCKDFCGGGSMHGDT